MTSDILNTKYLNRENSIEELKNTDMWDIVIIGGGATGLGIALDASKRGYRTLLLERKDFSHATSSRSTKLAHGGVRYLAQGNVGLVMEALKERGLMIQNAPHLVHSVPFVIPSYRWWEKYYYGIGLNIYDRMSRKLSLGKTRVISKFSIGNLFQNLNRVGLNGGVVYYDGQFDDSRMAINIAQTSVEFGAVLLNYFNVNEFILEENNIKGLVTTNLETGERFQINSKIIINATGVFADDIIRMSGVNESPIIKVSQGIHLILEKRFLDGDYALMIPKTKDGRVLFIVPWKDFLLVGTTDTPLEKTNEEPKALDEEIDFILQTIDKYLLEKPTKDDILSVFAGLRPLVVPRKKQIRTKEISRDHKIMVESNGLITIVGGKWTTYRKMAEDAVAVAIKTAHLRPVECSTENLKIHGSISVLEKGDALFEYGSDAPNILKITKENDFLRNKLHPKFSHIEAEVIWAVRNEMARTLEDVLARRLRILFLDARVAKEIAPKVAEIMAKELKKDKKWTTKQVVDFLKVVDNYLPK